MMAAAWVVAATVASGPALGRGPSITRGFPPLELGMSVEQFSKSVPAEEIAVAGDDRIFSVTGRRATVTGFLCIFTKGRLSRIEISHSVDYSARVPWQDFLAGSTREYGTGFRLKTQSGDVAMWDDGRTTLVLERRMVTERERSYVVTLLDDAIAIERNERCGPKMFV